MAALHTDTAKEPTIYWRQQSSNATTRPQMCPRSWAACGSAAAKRINTEKAAAPHHAAPCIRALHVPSALDGPVSTVLPAPSCLCASSNPPLPNQPEPFVLRWSHLHSRVPLPEMGFPLPEVSTLPSWRGPLRAFHTLSKPIAAERNETQVSTQQRDPLTIFLSTG